MPKSVVEDKYTSDMELVKEKMKELAAGKTDFWKPVEGDTNIRILPKFGVVPVFWLDVPVHFIDNRSYRCLNEKVSMNKYAGDCIACGLSQKLMDSDNPRRQEKGARIQMQIHTLVNVAIYHNSPDAMNKVWKVPLGITRDLLALYYGDYKGFDHPKTGIDMVLNRVGNTIKTKYKITPRRSETPTTRDLMDGRKDLTKIIKQVSAADLRKAVVDYVNSDKGK